MLDVNSGFLFKNETTYCGVIESVTMVIPTASRFLNATIRPSIIEINPHLALQQTIDLQPYVVLQY